MARQSFTKSEKSYCLVANQNDRDPTTKVVGFDPLISTALQQVALQFSLAISADGTLHIAPAIDRTGVGSNAQCAATDAAFFFKQWGGVQKSKTGRLLDGRTCNAFPKHSRRVNLQSLPAPTRGVRWPDARKYGPERLRRGHGPHWLG
jgi:hypothetical protein